MNTASLFVYLLPFMAGNGITNYVLTRHKEKQFVSKFDTIKIGKIEKNERNKDFDIPEELSDIISVLEKHIDEDNLNNLYNNLKTFRMRKNRLLLLLGVAGCYDGRKNSISYSIKGALPHETVHLASSHYDKKNNIHQSGFVIYNDNLKIGKALNEGYTDLLTRRLHNKKTRPYNNEVRIVEFLELLLGKNELENHYFNNDLKGLINKLSEYMGKKEAIRFITTFDIAHSLRSQSNPAYKFIYVYLQLKMCNLFEQNNRSLSKKYDYLKLLEKTKIANIIIKSKQMMLHKPSVVKI